MLVSKIKKEYPLVYERIVEQKVGNVDLSNPTMDVNKCLAWSSTKEGENFWLSIYVGNIDKAMLICPYLFEDDSPYKVIINGLFKS